MSDYSKMDDAELSRLIRKITTFSDAVYDISDADRWLTAFIDGEQDKGRYWNCTQELVLEQINGVQVYMRKATLFRGVAPNGVCYSVKRDDAARALAEVILMALDGMNGA